MDRSPPEPAGDPPALETAIVSRIAWLTLAIGFAAAIATGYFTHRIDWAKGIAIGAVLGWLNFRWLRRGIESLVRASVAQAGEEAPRVAAGATLAALLRYVLIGLLVYVIFIYLHVPLAGMAVGLCALAAATLAASVWEIVASQR